MERARLRLAAGPRLGRCGTVRWEPLADLHQDTGWGFSYWMEGKLNDWMPVLFVGLVVVCVTAFLLLEQKFRREGRKSNRTRRPF
jgi:hypothetical protein